MNLFLKFVAILVVCALVSGQEREGTDDSDRQTIQTFQMPSVLGQKPIRRLVDGIRERVKEGSGRVDGIRERAKEGSARFVSRLQSVIDDVRKRSQQLEENFLDHLSRLRPQAVDADKGLKALEKQKIVLTEKLNVVTNEFEERRSAAKTALREQKNVLDNQIRAVKDRATSTELEKESKDIDEKIKTVNDLPLIPMTRGLGDGYGRHLK